VLLAIAMTDNDNDTHDCDNPRVQVNHEAIHRKYVEPDDEFDSHTRVTETEQEVLGFLGAVCSGCGRTFDTVVDAYEHARQG